MIHVVFSCYFQSCDLQKVPPNDWKVPRSIDVPKFWSALQSLTGRGKESGRIRTKGRNLSLNAVDGFHRFLWFVDTENFGGFVFFSPILLFFLIHIFLKWLALETPSIVMNGCKSAYLWRNFPIAACMEFIWGRHEDFKEWNVMNMKMALEKVVVGQIFLDFFRYFILGCFFFVTDSW